MSNRVLCVDDETSFLSLYRQQLQGKCEVHTAQGADRAMEVLKDVGGFAVILSDLQMPGMNGTAFLSHAQQICPNTVRILVTGQADLSSAIGAVNEGHVFRFLTKPCPPSTLIGAVEAGIQRHSLLTSEKQLLEHTLRGSIEILNDVLLLANPAGLRRASRIRWLVRQVATGLEVAQSWQLEVAALLSQIMRRSAPGLSSTSNGDTRKLVSRRQSRIEAHPRVTRDLIRKVPGFEQISQIVFSQDLALIQDSKYSADVLLKGRILRLAIDCEHLESGGLGWNDVVKRLSEQEGSYTSEVFQALVCMTSSENEASSLVPIKHLRLGMILSDDIRSKSGVVLVRKGHEITETLLFRLLNKFNNGTVQEPIQVRMWNRRTGFRQMPQAFESITSRS